MPRIHSPQITAHWAVLSSLTQDDLWGSVMASGDNGAMVFMVKGGAAEVHHPHSRALHTALIPLLGAEQMRMNLRHTETHRLSCFRVRKM